MFSHLRRSLLSVPAVGLSLGALLFAAACKKDPPASKATPTPASTTGAPAEDVAQVGAAADYRFGPPGGYRRRAAEADDSGEQAGDRRRSRPERFEAFDVDGDGALSADEKQQMRAERQARRELRRTEILAAFDADKDGELSPTERATMHNQRSTEMFGRLDGDGDGKVTAAELAATGRRGPPIDLATADSDGDGALNQAEVQAARSHRRVPWRGERAPGDAPPTPGGAVPDAP